MKDLSALFAPRAVAVVGAGRTPASIGYQVVRNLVELGFAGPVYPVNPGAERILDIPCHATVEDLPDGVDMAVLVVPADQVIDTIRACHGRGIRTVVTVSAGFGESGVEGARRQAALRDVLDELDMRLVGPNCMGVIDTAEDVRLNASFAFTQPLPGNVAFASQSGSLGEAILSHARGMGLGLSAFVSLGNAVDVTAVDLIEHWTTDPRTHVILLYLESLPDAQVFMRAALAATRRAGKPILAVKSGRTRAGAQAASSHTGSMAGRDRLASALFERCGVVRVDEIAQLFTNAKAFSTQPLPSGPRVAILTNAGGPAIQATDATVHHGLQVARLSADTMAALARVLPPDAALTNPVDMMATARGMTFERCAEILLADPGVDSLLVIYVTPVILDTADVARRIAAGLRRGVSSSASPKPVLTCVMGKANGDPGEAVLREAGYPVYPFPEDAIGALASMHRHARWLEQDDGPLPTIDDVDDDAGRQLLAAQPDGWLDTDVAHALLQAYGIPLVPSRRVRTIDEAVAFQRRIDAPVALKVESDFILHKTDVGGVALDLRGADEIHPAHARIEAALGPDAPPHDFRVQAMVTGGVETIVGAVLDPVIGHAVMFGLGGIAVEIVRDVRFEMLPVTLQVARRLTRGIRGRRLLFGARGRRPVDVALLERVLVRVGRMITDHPRIAELDINPFVAHPDGASSGAVDVRIRLGLPESELSESVKSR